MPLCSPFLGKIGSSQSNFVTFASNSSLIPSKRASLGILMSLHLTNPESMYCRYYFEILDMIIDENQHQFDSLSFTFYVKVETILESAATRKEVLN